MSPQRETLNTLLDELSDEQITYLVQFIRAMKPQEINSELANPVDNDPLVGFISGPTDVAEHIEDFL